MRFGGVTKVVLLLIGYGERQKAWGPFRGGFRVRCGSLRKRNPVLLPDLPGETEDIVLTTILLHWMLENSRRALVIHANPRGLVERIEQGLTRMKAFAPGPFCRSSAELTNCLQEGRLPSLVVLDTTELSDAGIPALGESLGRLFFNTSPLVALCRPDRLPPVEATHLAFACIRLGLLAEDSAADRRFLVTGPDSEAVTLRLVPVLRARLTPMPLGLESTDTVSLHRGVSLDEGALGVSAAIRRAHEILVRAGVDVHVEDPAGLLSDHMLTVDGQTKTLDRSGTLAGRVCLIACSESEIAPVYRSAPNRVRHAAAQQLVVWWTPQTPVATYLMDHGRLAELAMRKALPAPVPLIGDRNRFLEELHLRLAIQEGRPNEADLGFVFTSQGLKRLLDGKKAHRGSLRTRYDDQSGRVSRHFEILPLPQPNDTLEARTTVTAVKISVMDPTGHAVDTVDRQTAPTHYYPLRVFSHRGGRYQVPVGRLGQHIRVSAVDSEKSPTIPKLRFDLEPGIANPDNDSRTVKGKLRIRVTEHAVRITEFVSEALDSLGQPSRFEPVSSEYNTRILVARLENLTGVPNIDHGLMHVARLLDDVLIAHLRAPDELIEVIGLPNGYGNDGVPAVAFIDRHIGGMGVVEILKPDVVSSLLRWTSVIMKSCACMDGCPRCTPPEVLSAKAKQTAIRILEMS